MYHFDRDSKRWNVLNNFYEVYNSNSSLTVEELIGILNKLPSEMKVMVDDDHYFSDVTYIDMIEPINRMPGWHDFKEQILVIG